MTNRFYRAAGARTFLKLFSLLTISLAFGDVVSSYAQDPDQFAIERAQAAVRDKIVRERGGSSNNVSFPASVRAETYFVSNAQTGVRGQGSYARDNNSRSRTFSYDAVVNNRNGRVQRVDYSFTGGDSGSISVPNWLVGTFRGRNPVGGQRVTVTIDSSGYASAVSDNGGREEGRYVGNTIRFGPAMGWDITRSGDGFRARSNRRSEEFSRTSGGDGGGDSGRVPQWAVGTFRGTTDSGESELIINADGTATARSLSTNRAFSGSYSNGVLRFEFGSFDVLREGDGIRTRETGNRSNQTTYQRLRP